jgi:MFS family permease
MTTLSMERVGSLPILGALRVRDFRLLWASEAVSVLGDQFHFVAMSWLVISLTGSGLALGTVLIAVGVPRAILLVPFGVVADRRSPRTMMLASHAARALVVGAIAVLVITGHASIPALAALGALFGCADAAYMPAQQAFLPRTLDAERLPSANALLQGTMQLASIAGPPIAGVVVAIAGAGSAFAVDAASFVFAGILVALITAAAVAVVAREPVAAAGAVVSAAPDDAASAAGAGAGDGAGVNAALDSAAAPAESFRDALAGGIRYVAADAGIRTMLLLSLVLNFALNGPAAVGMPWLAERRFDAGPAGLGLMAAAWAAGALAGTVLAGSLRLERGGRIVLAGIAAAGISMAVVGLALWMPAVVTALAVMGVAIGYVNVVAISWLQARVEPAMAGRVMSVVMLMGFGITPLSLGLAGALIDLDATAMFTGAGMIVLGATGLAVALGASRLFDGPPRQAAGSTRPSAFPPAPDVQ